MRVWSLGWEDPLEEDMETHSNILAWRIIMDRGGWCATIHGTAKSWTQLKWLSTHTHTYSDKFQTSALGKQGGKGLILKSMVKGDGQCSVSGRTCQGQWAVTWRGGGALCDGDQRLPNVRMKMQMHAMVKDTWLEQRGPWGLGAETQKIGKESKVGTQPWGNGILDEKSR